MRDKRFRWRSGRGIWPQWRGYWSPTLTVKDPQIPHLSLETPSGQAGYVDLAATLAGAEQITAALSLLRDLAATMAGSETITAALGRLMNLLSSATGATAATAALGLVRNLIAEIAGMSVATAEIGLSRALYAAIEGATQIAAELTVDSGAPPFTFWAPAWRPPERVEAVDVAEEESMLLLMGLFHPAVYTYAAPRLERMRVVVSKRLDDERMLATLVERLLAEQLDRVLENPDWEREEQVLYEALFPVLMDMARKEAARELRRLRRRIPKKAMTHAAR